MDFKPQLGTYQQFPPYRAVIASLDWRGSQAKLAPAFKGENRDLSKLCNPAKQRKPAFGIHAKSAQRDSAMRCLFPLRPP